MSLWSESTKKMPECIGLQVSRSTSIKIPQVKKLFFHKDKNHQTVDFFVPSSLVFIFGPGSFVNIWEFLPSFQKIKKRKASLRRKDRQVLFSRMANELDHRLRSHACKRDHMTIEFKET